MVLSRAQCRRISGFNFDFVIAFVLGLPQHGAGLTQRELWTVGFFFLLKNGPVQTSAVSIFHQYASFGGRCCRVSG